MLELIFSLFFIYSSNFNLSNCFQFRYIDSRLPSGIDISWAKVVAYFGTHSIQCHISDLIWRLGPSCILEDPLTDDAISTVYKLGPNYSACFQAPVVSEHYEVENAIHILFLASYISYNL